MKRRRRIDPSKAVAAALGGFYRGIPAPEKRPGSGCGEFRSSVDSSGLCGNCRATAVVRKNETKER